MSHNGIAQQLRVWAGRSEDLPKRAVRGWVIWISVVAVLAGLTLDLVRNSGAAQLQQRKVQWWYTHTLNVLIDAEKLDTALNKAARGERGYLLTGHSRSLATYNAGLAEYNRLAPELTRLTRDNASQQQRTAELQRHAQGFTIAAGQVVELVQNGQNEAALRVARAGLERMAVERASLVLSAIKAEENRLLHLREARDAVAAARIRNSGLVVSALNGLLVLLVAVAAAAMLRSRNGALVAAREARESGARYRLLAEHSNDMIVRLGLDGVRRYVSPASPALLGYRPEEMLGGKPVAAIHVDDRARVVAVCRSLLAGVESPMCTYRQQHREGHYVWLEATYRLIRDDDGEPIEFVASVRDVSRRKAVELEAAEASARLQENHRLFTMASALAHVGHWRVDLVRQNVVWSEEVYHIHGISPECTPDLEGAINFYHPDDRERVAGLVARAIKTGENFYFTAALIRPDGEVRYITSRGQAERAPDGSVLGLFGVVQDISDRFLAEAAMRRSEEQYRLLADNATDLIFRTDEQGIVIYASPSCEEVSTWAPEDLIGRYCGDFLHPEDRKAVHTAHMTLVTGAQSAVTVEYRLQCKDGGWRWLESHMKAWSVSGNAAGGVLSSIRHIGTRKQLETELVAAREKAESAAQAKANFLANMSHEIRTPMNGVLGFAELMLSGDLGPEQRRYADLIADSGRSMMRLLNDILDVSKIESGAMQVTAEPLDLRHIVQRCTDLMAPIATIKGVAVSATVDPAIPSRIIGDPLRLRQVVLNLVGNAVKFTERGAITVEAKAVGNTLQIDVADTGVGIPADRLDAIFDQFAQADETTARTYGGTGLGLTISGELARLMGGSITVRSMIDKGTTFTIRLPLRVAESSLAAVGAGEAIEPRGSRTRTPRVLIAEDHDINQELIVAMAHRAGMEPVIASNGVEVIAMVQEAVRAGRRFDLVLMDMQMPVMDGLEAARQLRASGHSAETLPIVALTANAYAEDIDACRAAGMQAHLAKPVRVKDLTEVLARFVAADTPAPAPSGVSTGSARDSTAAPASPNVNPKLLARFEARTAETLRRLEELASMTAPTPQDVHLVADGLHKLAGTAALFGRETLGTSAANVEHELESWVVAGRSDLLKEAAMNLRMVA